ncbi:MAG: tRNA (N(6)-L-threonylcarbamoyladenosine(37)-C(2))-methylthiotransferase MtaB [Alphaproteobacteria bacterium]|nr:tRNA (N(6)-L-threonylcarbamoyladenosine(37)-C(2))-methylthiotransferase MtaB [Alphaproteobacteria bacterium]
MIKIVTFGCRINAYESEILKEKLKNYDNLIIVNTCAVTAEAERQCRQMVRKLKRENPESKIIITGCSAQVSADKFAQMSEVDLVLGNKEKRDIEKYLNMEISSKTIISNIFDYDSYDSYIITGFEGRQRAFVQIQQGCNHRCTYCIVPYARGNNRSVPAQDIINQIRTLINEGFKEICLTGVDACSYQPSFTELVKQILQQIPELPYLQFGSLDPAAIDDDFIELIKQYPNITPHFHFSIQSGDNLILKRMKRRHTREDVINLCHKIRQARPQSSFGADFICGFPTETDEQFQNTVKLVHEAGINKLHVFPYSERPGTPASLMPQVPVDVRKHRAQILRQQGETIDD